MFEASWRPRLVDSILELGAIRDADILRTRTLKVAGHMGFDSFLFAGKFCIDGSRSRQQVMSNYPEEWTSHYDTQGYAAIDPTVIHSTHSLLPIVWRRKIYVSESQKRLRHEAMGVGLKSGATFPVQSREGDIGLLSLALNSEKYIAISHVMRSVAWGALLATAVHEAARAIVKSEALVSRPRLTRREAEVLRWLVAGKSNWDVSVVMGISEHGVVHHVRNILHKLDVVTRRQAVVKAIALGLTA
jgi:LuxR family transcriptional regulator, quorum-sensing system regulator LasR